MEDAQSGVSKRNLLRVVNLAVSAMVMSSKTSEINTGIEDTWS